MRELPDGRLLLHDFGGCDTQAILEALGLTFRDLPAAVARQRTCRRLQPFARSHPGGRLVELADHELVVAVFLLDEIKTAGTVTGEQLQRLTQSAARIGWARDQAHGR